MRCLPSLNRDLPSIRKAPFRSTRSLVLAFLAACGSREPERLGTAAGPVVLPTGRRLEPAGRIIDVGNMPLSVQLAPDGHHAVLLLSGWRECGLQVVDLAAGQITQTLSQPGAFVGLAFSPDGRSLYTSGAGEDLVYRYAWSDGRATLADSIVLAERDTASAKKRFPAGLALSADGKTLYVAENMGDSLAVVDIATARVKQRLPAGHYPYAVTVAPSGEVYVSAWGEDVITTFRPMEAGMLAAGTRVLVGRHPSGMVLNRAGDKLFVTSSSTDRIAVVDTRSRRVVKLLEDPAPAGPSEGSTPNALALSPDERRLFVAEGDNSAVAVFDLESPQSGGTKGTAGTVSGRIPVLWYPTALAIVRDSLLVVSGKGRGTAPNPSAPQSGPGKDPRAYTLGQLNGALNLVPLALSNSELAELSARTARANGWDSERRRKGYPPFTHVMLIIKENRTYDQVLGDLPEGDGDTALVFFPRPVSPNHHALAERFGLYDRFFTNAEVSAQGHPWSTSAYVTEYTEKTVHSLYADRRPDVNEGEVGRTGDRLRVDRSREEGARRQSLR